MEKQLNLNFDDTGKIEPDGKQLRDEGIERAKNHADDVFENWSQCAYDFLLQYMELHDEFTTEDVRNASLLLLSEPPDNRAWDSVIIRAVKSGLITRINFTTAKNPSSHYGTIAVWQVIKN